jgi:hypothetical protein
MCINHACTLSIVAIIDGVAGRVGDVPVPVASNETFVEVVFHIISI